MSKLERISTFIAVVEQNSFVSAAKKLNIAPTTVTRQIHALEQEVGSALLERTTRRLKLTEVGSLYYQEAKKLIEQFTTVENLTTHLQSEPAGNLRVVAHHFFAKQYLVPHLAEFMQKYPKIVLHLGMSEQAPDFHNEEIDLLFGTLGEGASHLVRRRIFSGKFLFCASPEYLAKHGTPQKPEDLLHHAFVTHTIRQPPDLLTFNNHSSLYVQPILWLNDSETMVNAALQGIGVIKILDFRVQEYLQTGRLVEVLEEYGEPNYPGYLYYRGTPYLDSKIRAFIDFFTAKIPQSL